MSNHATTQRLKDDLAAVLRDAELLMQASAEYGGEKTAEARARIRESLDAARRRLHEAEQSAIRHGEDAVHATRAAVEEGILPGGGVALLRARARLGALKGANADQASGIAIVMRALEEPLRQIVANAGEEPSVVLDRVLAGADNFGFNALTAFGGQRTGEWIHVEIGKTSPRR